MKPQDLDRIERQGDKLILYKKVLRKHSWPWIRFLFALMVAGRAEVVIGISGEQARTKMRWFLDND